MENKRRDFLKKSLKIGAVGAVGVAASQALAKNEQDYGDTVRGKSPKKEVLYWESEAWKKYYKVAY
ncbi:twin-arginine translocation signal domain-containing protein [uncultured Campylobacter sp.]|jgi:tat pathway signal sequence|uniref:twin-arginine translocation signal domain-containing protein n=1 Tax=uncultured Campylobacter sp. TaxID=218934 RepID=UPI0026337A53|nr:twin-arginine translocation signal domain-containing protein [uncultured Campylobacter sp.]